MDYYKKIVGSRCYLSPIRIEDAAKYAEWLNDLEIGQYLEIFHQQLNLEKEKTILKNMIEKGDQIFAIVGLDKDKLIGNCSLFDLDQLNRKAELGIFIGAKDYWDNGYGSEATRLVLDYGFNILNLRNIMLKVYEYNKRALSCYQKIGFREIGRRRKAKLISGKAWDIIYMDILAEEFDSIYVSRITSGE